MAAARLAAIATPLNARLTAPELRGLLADAAPRVLIHEDGDAARMQDACRDLAPAPAPADRLRRERERLRAPPRPGRARITRSSPSPRKTRCC